MYSSGKVFGLVLKPDQAISKELVELSKKLGKLSNSLVESYFPHITLAKWERLPSAQLPIVDVRFVEIETTPTLALMGEHGVALETVASL